MAVDFNESQAALWRDISVNLGGVDAVFTPMVGDVSCFKVMLSEFSQSQPEGRAQTWLQGKTIDYSLSDLSREVEVGDVFVIAGISYTVLSVLTNDGYVVRVSVNGG
jgi:hypothetical protein